jgi:UDP-N-acetylmuramate dehydrogenase
MALLGAKHTSDSAWQQQFAARLRKDADLSKTNWFRVGGVADYLFKPENSEDLAAFFKAVPHDVPITVLGVGSNLIVRDGGIEGVVIKLGRWFADMQVVDDGLNGTSAKLVVGAGCLDINVALFACDHGFAGLEFLSGIPGTMGGAVFMNAGAYGSDISQVLIDCEVVLRSGEIRYFTNQEMGFTYRHSQLPEGAIVTRAVLQATPDEHQAIAQRMQEISSKREETQPIRSRTGGSTFKNPNGYKAWELIDKAGCRGMKLGGAQVSELHCNFLINTGEATAADLESLGEQVIAVVKEKTGVTLEWEIRRIGRK